MRPTCTSACPTSSSTRRAGRRPKLIESARRPEDLLFGAAAASGGLQINATYYITKRFLPRARAHLRSDRRRRAPVVLEGPPPRAPPRARPADKRRRKRRGGGGGADAARALSVGGVRALRRAVRRAAGGVQRVRRRGRRRAQRAAAAPAHARGAAAAPPPPLRAVRRASPASELHVGAECAALDCEVLYARLKTARHAAVAEEHVRWLEEGY